VKKSVNETRAGRWKLILILGVCAAPMVFSYFTYFVIKPGSRTNYGAILDPRRYPMPHLGTQLLGGAATELNVYKGKWILLQADGGACDASCQKKLYDIRQLRLTQGREMDRIERVWLITDNEPIDTLLLRAYDGAHLLRVQESTLKKWLPTESDTNIHDHIYVIDPLGNLMMRFPKNADPNKIKRDIAKLLRASAIG
jgi:hypothetical protein